MGHHLSFNRLKYVATNIHTIHFPQRCPKTSLWSMGKSEISSTSWFVFLDFFPAWCWLTMLGGCLPPCVISFYYVLGHLIDAGEFLKRSLAFPQTLCSWVHPASTTRRAKRSSRPNWPTADWRWWLSSVPMTAPNCSKFSILSLMFFSNFQWKKRLIENMWLVSLSLMQDTCWRSFCCHTVTKKVNHDDGYAETLLEWCCLRFVSAVSMLITANLDAMACGQVVQMVLRMVKFVQNSSSDILYVIRTCGTFVDITLFAR